MILEVVKQVGTVLGLVVGLITLGQKIVSFRNKQSKRRKASEKVAQLPIDTYISFNFLPKQEIAVIIGTALLVNAVALALVTRLTSILYLDMTGTAIAALLLGPWYGAIAGLLSSGIVNVLLYPGDAGYDAVFPWAIVNICGGLLWGQFGRSLSFVRYMAAENSGLGRQVLYLLKFGVLGAVIMAIPGTGVELALGHQGILDPKVAESLQLLMSGPVAAVKDVLTPMFGETVSGTIARWGVVWAKNSVMYIPDKTLSFAISIIAIKAAYPLFERELIHSRINAVASAPGWLDPCIFFATFIPYIAILIFSNKYGWLIYWPLWTAPIWIAFVGMILESLFTKATPRRSRQRLEREQLYERARSFLPMTSAARPGANFAVAGLAASLLFVLILQPLVSSASYYRIAFNFFCLVYGFQLMLYLYGVTLSQNLAIRAKDDQSLLRDTAKAG
jgi:uncharacterized membrane protein